MRIHIGSTNPIKVQAAAEVLANYPLFSGAEVAGVDVDSGVSSQPKSLEETALGARNRASLAFEGADIAVGLESGLVCAELSDGDLVLTACVCSVFDGARHYYGMSSGFQLPPKVLSLINQGNIDLNQAIFQAGITQNTELGRSQGTIGVLTNDRIHRKDLNHQALTTALIGLEHPNWFKL